MRGRSARGIVLGALITIAFAAPRGAWPATVDWRLFSVEGSTINVVDMASFRRDGALAGVNVGKVVTVGAAHHFIQYRIEVECGPSRRMRTLGLLGYDLDVGPPPGPADTSVIADWEPDSGSFGPRLCAAPASFEPLPKVPDLRAEAVRRQPPDIPAEYDSNIPVLLKGVVVEADWSKQPIIIHIVTPDGQRWALQALSRNTLLRGGVTEDSLKVGRQIVVRGFAARDKRCEPECKAYGRDVTFPDSRRGTGGY